MVGKKVKTARIADDKVIVYNFRDQLSFPFLFVESGDQAVLLWKVYDIKFWPRN